MNIEDRQRPTMIVIRELGLERQERTRESHSVVLLGTPECALDMSNPVTRRSEVDRQNNSYHPSAYRNSAWGSAWRN
jgi:hypothetical protein